MLQNPWLSKITSLSDLIPLSVWARPSLIILKNHMMHDSGHDEGHLLRVVRNALWFSSDGDLDVIIPAALLHDLVNVPKDSPDRSIASKLSADKAIALLGNRLPFESEDHRLQIHHAIEAHSYSANIPPNSIEAKAIQDADRIDALGYIGLARLFSVGGSLKRELCHPYDPAACFRTPSQLDEQKYTLDHFYTKLISLPGTMQTNLGRQVADMKLRLMLDFIDGFAKEMSGEIVVRD